MEERKVGPLEKIGYLFYIVSPNRTSFATPGEVPNFIVEVVPFIVFLILLELCIAAHKRKPIFSMNDSIVSISHGMLYELSRLVSKGLHFTAYIYIYNNWRIVSLPWNSVWTWLLCLVGVDFAYYWLHRASHDINILWAAHQVHHSSEYFNLSTAVREPVLKNLSIWMFYLPMAFAIPPSLFLVHYQFNLVYQFWLHTEFINTIGPFGYILNTPSHHRVHHGRNRYSIDKNFGGLLIIWDRMFGTFEPESQEIVYGVTHPINTFAPFYIQLCHYMHIWKTFCDTKGFKNKLSVIFKGPGWEPGKPWHGNPEDIPDIRAPVEKHNPKIRWWCTSYAFVHFTLILLGHIEITERSKVFSQVTLLSIISYQILSLAAVGALLDGRYYAPWLELMRCTLFVLVDFYFLPITRIATLPATTMLITKTVLRICFISSTFLWLVYCIKATSNQHHAKNYEKIK